MVGPMQVYSTCSHYAVDALKNMVCLKGMAGNKDSEMPSWGRVI
jgi:hypothetical protein